MLHKYGLNLVFINSILSKINIYVLLPNKVSTSLVINHLQLQTSVNVKLKHKIRKGTYYLGFKFQKKTLQYYVPLDNNGSHNKENQTAIIFVCIT